jgi:hypothetical protein
MIENDCNHFKKRYVLGEGFPWLDIGEKQVSLSSDPADNRPIILRMPNELFDPSGIPKYRLVLERVHDHEK